MFRVLFFEKDNEMDRVTKGKFDSYYWTCLIDIDYNRQSAKKGLWGIAAITAFILILFFLMPSGPGREKEIWIPFLIIGVILLVGLPLIYLQYSATAPQEEYMMNEEFVKSGYSRSAIFSKYREIKELIITPKYLELIGEKRSNRIYVPAEDMDFVKQYIIQRLPEETKIKEQGK